MNSARALAMAACLLVLGVPWSAVAAAGDAALERGDYWTMWERATQRQCPGNQLQWVGMTDEATGLVGSFDATLSRGDQRRIEGISDYLNRCRQEIAGFGCFLAVHVDAYNRLGLLKRFARFGCEAYDCYKDETCVFRGNRDALKVH